MSCQIHYCFTGGVDLILSLAISLDLQLPREGNICNICQDATNNYKLQGSDLMMKSDNDDDLIMNLMDH